MKEILLASTTIKTKITQCLSTILGCYPNKSNKKAIKSLQLANLVTLDNQPNLDLTNQTKKHPTYYQLTTTPTITYQLPTVSKVH